MPTGLGGQREGNVSREANIGSEPDRVPKHGLYRWHIMDPIRFDEDLRVTIQELGWWPSGEFQPLMDDIASVGYW